jgi:hypothetical protein
MIKLNNILNEGAFNPANIKAYYEALCKNEKVTPLPVRFGYVGKGGAALTFNPKTMKPLYISFNVNRMVDPEQAVIHELTHQIKLETEKDAYIGKRDQTAKFKKLENRLFEKYAYSKFSNILWKESKEMIKLKKLIESVADIKSFRNKENDSWNDTMIKLVLMRKIDGKTAVYRLETDNWFRRFENPGKGYGIMIRGIKIAPNPVKVSPNLVIGPNQSVLKAIITYLPNEFTSVDDDVKENYETAKGFIVLGNKNFTGFEMLQTLNPKDLELFIKSNIGNYNP